MRRAIIASVLSLLVAGPVLADPITTPGGDPMPSETTKVSPKVTKDSKETTKETTRDSKDTTKDSKESKKSTKHKHKKTAHKKAARKKTSHKSHKPAPATTPAK